jgi:uncharacterized Ntn-hydrolase superfamily protein
MTYSIVACDRAAGAIGIAVQSHWFAVGAIVPWGAAGVGVVATQANSDLGAGRRGLRLLAQTGSAQSALDGLIRGDPRSEVSQMAVLDAHGQAAVHTGTRCIAEAGHRSGDGWSVQANMMLRPTVPDAMAAAWVAGAGMRLPARLLAALRAAQAEGGDVRGKQSAAMLVMSLSPAPPPMDKLLDIRVDDSRDPIGELERLCQLGEAYQEHELGLELVGTDPQRALQHAARASELVPGTDELDFWRAIALASLGRQTEAREILRGLFAASPGWRRLLARLPAAGLLPENNGLDMAREDQEQSPSGMPAPGLKAGE